MRILITTLSILLIPQAIMTGPHRGKVVPAPTACSGTTSCWPMTEGSGATFFDQSGNNNDVISANPSNFTWNTGTSPITGSIPHFNGSVANSIASNTSLTAFDGTTPFSVGMWIQTGSGFATQSNILSNVTSDPTDLGWAIYINPNAQFGFFLCHDAGSGNFINVLSPTSIIGANGVFYIEATYDGLGHASGVTLYINGTPVIPASTTDNLAGLSSASPNAMAVGQNPDGSFPAIFAETSTIIYPFQRNSTQVLASFTAGPIP